MKLVLSPNRRKYDRFISKLWENDKDVSGYRYVNSISCVLGYDRDTKVIKLGGYRDHPHANRIMEECERRFDMSPRHRDGMEEIRNRWGEPTPVSRTSPDSLRYQVQMEATLEGYVAFPRQILGTWRDDD